MEWRSCWSAPHSCEDRVLDGPASGEKGSKGRNLLDSHFLRQVSFARKGQVKAISRSGSEAGSYLRLIDFVYHSTLGLRVKKKKRRRFRARRRWKW